VTAPTQAPRHCRIRHPQQGSPASSRSVADGPAARAAAASPGSLASAALPGSAAAAAAAAAQRASGKYGAALGAGGSGGQCARHASASTAAARSSAAPAHPCLLSLCPLHAALLQASTAVSAAALRVDRTWAAQVGFAARKSHWAAAAQTRVKMLGVGAQRQCRFSNPARSQPAVSAHAP